MSLTKEQENICVDAIKSNDFIQKLIAFQAENDDEFDIGTRLVINEELKAREYKDNLKELLQASLNSKAPVYVRLNDHAVIVLTVEPIYERTRDYIRDPYADVREPHNMHLHEDKRPPKSHNGEMPHD